jgi:hypothetical protein
MLIYCNGDSFVDGWELGDDLMEDHPGWLPYPYKRVHSEWIDNLYKHSLRNKSPNMSDDIHKRNRERCFAGLLESKYGHTVVNGAMNGASFERITRTTIVDLIKLKANHDNITVIIGLTGIHRHEVPRNPAHHPGPRHGEWVDTMTSIPSVHPHAKDFNRFNALYMTDDHAMVRALVNLTHIKSFCDANNMRLLFVEPGITPEFTQQRVSKDPDIKVLGDYLKLDWCINMLEIAKTSNEREVFCPDGHFSPRMHEIFAEEINKHLQ